VLREFWQLSMVAWMAGAEGNGANRTEFDKRMALTAPGHRIRSLAPAHPVF
jgi:hypothetical protein